jgi:hypothetical protein
MKTSFLIPFLILCFFNSLVIAQSRSYSISYIKLFLERKETETPATGSINGMVVRIDETKGKIETVYNSGDKEIEKIIKKEKVANEENTIKYTTQKPIQSGRALEIYYIFVDKFYNEITVALASGNKGSNGLKPRLRNYMVFKYK